MNSVHEIQSSKRCPGNRRLTMTTTGRLRGGEGGKKGGGPHARSAAVAHARTQLGGGTDGANKCVLSGSRRRGRRRSGLSAGQDIETEKRKRREVKRETARNDATRFVCLRACIPIARKRPRVCRVVSCLLTCMLRSHSEQGSADWLERDDDCTHGLFSHILKMTILEIWPIYQAIALVKMPYRPFTIFS